MGIWYYCFRVGSLRGDAQTLVAPTGGFVVQKPAPDPRLASSSRNSMSDITCLLISHQGTGVRQEAEGFNYQSFIYRVTVESCSCNTAGIRKMYQYPNYRYNQCKFLLFDNGWNTDLVS
jgi:hypothetical protein